MQMQNFEKHVWAEIDLDALRANFRTVKPAVLEKERSSIAQVFAPSIS